MAFVVSIFLLKEVYRHVDWLSPRWLNRLVHNLAMKEMKAALSSGLGVAKVAPILDR